jgi:hypothetical protein
MGKSQKSLKENFTNLDKSIPFTVTIQQGTVRTWVKHSGGIKK